MVNVTYRPLPPPAVWVSWASFTAFMFGLQGVHKATPPEEARLATVARGFASRR